MSQENISQNSNPSRGDILTEKRNPASTNLDQMSISETLALINGEDQGLASAVHEALPQIEQFVAKVVEAFDHGGRLIYVGAGTSGRLGVLDASECPPTFSTPPEMVVGIIAGGPTALTRSIEDIEDSPEAGARDLNRASIASRDIVLGITAGGTTPYVLGALARAREVGCFTGLFLCSVETDHNDDVDVIITVPVGPEVLTGSTRLKAGTATKMVLNMITTTAMVQLNKTYENLMVDLKALNSKLWDRGSRIIAEITGLNETDALALLKRADGEVKTAIAMQMTGATGDDARIALSAADGTLRTVIDQGS